MAGLQCVRFRAEIYKYSLVELEESRIARSLIRQEYSLRERFWNMCTEIYGIAFFNM